MTRRKKTLADRAWTASVRYAKIWKEVGNTDQEFRVAASGYFVGYLAGRRAERRAAAKRLAEALDPPRCGNCALWQTETCDHLDEGEEPCGEYVRQAKAIRESAGR